MILRSLRLVHPSSAEYVASNTFSSDHYSWHSYRAAVGHSIPNTIAFLFGYESGYLPVLLIATSECRCVLTLTPISGGQKVSEGDPWIDVCEDDVSRNSLARPVKAHDTTRCACRVARVGMIRSCRSVMNVLGHEQAPMDRHPDFVSRFWPELFLLRLKLFRK